MSLSPEGGNKKQLEREFKVFLDAIALPAVIIDQKANFLNCNPPAAEAFANLGLKLSNKTCTKKLEQMFIAIDNKPYSRKNLSIFGKIFTKAKFVKKYQLELLHKHLKSTYILNVGTLPTTKKAKHLALIVFRDITDELKRRNLQKTFIKIVGHELKQPLGLIKAHTYYLKRFFNLTAYSEEVDHVKKIEDQVNIIAQTFNDVVDATRFSLQTFAINVELTNILELLTASVEELKVLHPDREIKLPEINPVVINCLIDPIRTRQVFTNILINALKYSPEHTPVEITVKLLAKRFIVNFTDHGPGIDPPELHNIFEPYFRSSDARKKKVKGLGLGLSFVQNMMLRQGGAVTVKSQLNHGSTFTLSFPLAT